MKGLLLSLLKNHTRSFLEFSEKSTWVSQQQKSKPELLQKNSLETFFRQDFNLHFKLFWEISFPYFDCSHHVSKYLLLRTFKETLKKLTAASIGKIHDYRGWSSCTIWKKLFLVLKYQNVIINTTLKHRHYRQ